MFSCCPAVGETLRGRVSHGKEFLRWLAATHEVFFATQVIQLMDVSSNPSFGALQQRRVEDHAFGLPLLGRGSRSGWVSETHKEYPLLVGLQGVVGFGPPRQDS